MSINSYYGVDLSDVKNIFVIAAIFIAGHVGISVCALIVMFNKKKK